MPGNTAVTTGGVAPTTDEGTRREVLRRVAKVARKQGLHALAARKYTQVQHSRTLRSHMYQHCSHLTVCITAFHHCCFVLIAYHENTTLLSSFSLNEQRSSTVYVLLLNCECSENRPFCSWSIVWCSSENTVVLSA